MEDWEQQLRLQVESNGLTPEQAFEAVLDEFRDYADARREEVESSEEYSELRSEMEAARAIFTRFAGKYNIRFPFAE